MRVLIATDSFPPGCGGSGWSTYELACGLRARGHEIHVVQPRPGQRRDGTRTYGPFEVREIAVAAPDVPFLRNYFKNERLYRHLSAVLRSVIRVDRIDLIHGQHVLTTPPAIAAARDEGIPVVCTIRDYWPVCYWSDLIYRSAAEDLCPACSPGMMTQCIRPRAPRAWPLAVPLIPYMRSNLRRKRMAVSQADAIVAVSTTIAADLRARAPELANSRIEIIPNPLDVEGLRAATSACEPPLTRPYAIYVGKLAHNKGVSKLLPAVDRARLPWPLVIVGDGPDRAGLERAAAESRRDVRFLGWLPREEALRWLRYASIVVFPSKGPESLSRVLLEASALERPIAAINTGGTPDIIIDGQTGLLSADVEGLAADIARLFADPGRAARLGEAARRHVQQNFDTPRVIARVEALYETLLAERREIGRARR